MDQQLKSSMDQSQLFLSMAQPGHLDLRSASGDVYRLPKPDWSLTRGTEQWAGEDTCTPVDKSEASEDCHERSGWYCPISSSLQPDVQQRSAPAEEDKDEQQWRGIRRCHMLGAPLQYVIDMHGIDQDLRLSYVKLFVVIE